MEYETRPPNDESQDGPGFPMRRRKSMSEIMIIHKIQELQHLMQMHKTTQEKFDPLAHCQYWLRELSILDCEMRLSHARVDLNHNIRQRLIKNSLDTLESYLKGIDVIDSTLYRITSEVVRRASADMKDQGPPFDEEELQTMRLGFHNLLTKSSDGRASRDWCPVTRLFFSPSELRPTYIFPYWVGEHIMKLIFGTNFVNDTLTTNNGLVVHESVAIALVNLWIVIVPTGAPRSGRWKVRVVKKDLLNRYMGSYNRRWQTIENQELNFQGSDRPSERYLYWHYATARVHASTRQPANFWTDLLGQDCWKPYEQYIRLDYLDAYIERRRDFNLEKFDDLRICAMPVWSPGTCLDIRIAAKLMSNVLDRQHEMVIWRNAGPSVDREDGYGGDIGGYGADLEDSERPVEEANPNGKPAHVIGPKVTRPPPESPYTGPPNRDLFNISSEGELEDAENQDVRREKRFALGDVPEPSLSDPSPMSED